ncbi:MAG: 5'/3'-nucleotidase SurE [Opitutales bacterium]
MPDATEPDPRPLALVTNDDGIRSSFLHSLARGLRANGFAVVIAAPHDEQSWVGRKMSRRETVSCEQVEGLAGPAWALSGTPSDCVNIAIGHLLDRRPDVICSGINVGHNVTHTLILASGTVAGAMEGAYWGIPSIAFSKKIEADVFDRLREQANTPHHPLRDEVDADGQRAGLITRAFWERPWHRGDVINVNFPSGSGADTPIRLTRPAGIELGCLFAPEPDGGFAFQYSAGNRIDEAADTDLAVLDSGDISLSVLRFAQIADPLDTQAFPLPDSLRIRT